jgi:amino acid transporter/nucleotide-binding universal stress UspA family protein
MNTSVPEQELARDLGLLEAYTMGVGTMIGAGIFVLPSIAAANAGPASMVSFAVGGVVSLLAALSLSELATGMPKAGGSYYYVNHALGGFFGSIVGWGMWSGLMFATAFYMLGFGQYLTFFWGRVPVAGAALAMAAALIYLNYRGVKETGALQNVIVVLLLGLIALFAGTGVFHVDFGTLRPFNPSGWGAVATTAATVYVAFIGFEVIASSAEEIEDPARNLPLAMIASVLTPTLLYVLVMLVSTGVLPVPELAGSRIPVADVARQFAGPVGALLMVVGAVLATVSSANASILSAARVNFAMGRDRILTNWLNDVHDRFRTPYRAILVTGGVILALIAAGVGIETLADVASFTYLVTYACVHVALVVMRRADPPEYDPSFRLPDWSYPALPVVGALTCLVIMATMRPVVLLLGTGIVLLGVAWFWLYARDRAVKPSLVGEAIAPSAGRPAEAGERYRVVVPVANPATERFLLRMAAEAARERSNPELIAVNVIEVPPQTALDQQLQFEEERVEMQRELLRSARDAASDLGVGLRTRAIVGRDAGEAVVDVVREERADQVFVGWSGKRSRARHVLGSAIDPIVTGSDCEVTLVKPRRDGEVGRVVALVGEGPHSALAARRARAFARARGVRLVLANVQPPEVDDPDGPDSTGRALVRRVGDRVGIDPSDYDSAVWIGDDVTETILRELRPDDLVCVGATRSTALTQALFGSIPEEIASRAEGTMAIVRGREYRPRSLVDAVVERLRG